MNDKYSDRSANSGSRVGVSLLVVATKLTCIPLRAIDGDGITKADAKIDDDMHSAAHNNDDRFAMMRSILMTG
jgi:hypothetical protein